MARNWDPFPVPPASIDTLLLTHAHVDHCGYLPRLVHDGFHGRIVSTPVTAEIAAIILTDSAKIQMEDAAYKKKRHTREKRTGPHPEVPLYTLEDVTATLPLFDPVAYDTPVPIGDGITAEFRDAGHILGSSSVLVAIGTRRRAAHGALFGGRRPLGQADAQRPGRRRRRRLDRRGIDLRRPAPRADGADQGAPRRGHHGDAPAGREHHRAELRARAHAGGALVPQRPDRAEADPAPAGLRRQPDGGARDGRLREAPGDPRRADARR